MTEKSEQVERLAYTVDQACYVLSIGRTSLYELFKTGELKPIKIAGRTLVARCEIDRLIADALKVADVEGGIP